MKGILLISHHTLANAFVETSRMLIGEQDCLDSIGLLEGQAPDDFRDQLCHKLFTMKEKGYTEVLVMADLYGGTPCNQAMQLLRDWKLHIVSGINLPMLLQTVLMNDDAVSVGELMDVATQNGKEGIQNVDEMLQKLMEL